jgi:hypothetical protein
MYDDKWTAYIVRIKTVLLNAFYDLLLLLLQSSLLKFLNQLLFWQAYSMTIHKFTKIILALWTLKFQKIPNTLTSIQ